MGLFNGIRLFVISLIEHQAFSTLPTEGQLSCLSFNIKFLVSLPPLSIRAISSPKP